MMPSTSPTGDRITISTHERGHPEGKRNSAAALVRAGLVTTLPSTATGRPSTPGSTRRGSSAAPSPFQWSDHRYLRVVGHRIRLGQASRYPSVLDATTAACPNRAWSNPDALPRPVPLWVVRVPTFPCCTR